MKKSLHMFALAIVMAFAAAPMAFAQDHSKIEEGIIFTIPIDHPKILTPSEFVKLGRPIRILAPAIYTTEFKMAFSKRPNILSCLSPNQPDENFIDLSLFLWQELASEEEARVCLFYVADILDKPAAMLKWFTEQGFHVDVYNKSNGLSQSGPVGTRLYATNILQQRRSSKGFWNKQFDILSRNLFGVPEWHVFDYHSGGSIDYLDNDAIYDVNMNRTGK